ncbi:MAG: S8 family serine peptidase [Candidatus Riflebacteria bacterium]|nr:S8 family serine peptidase [Candidatus Riflebacteria bacterium]
MIRNPLGLGLVLFLFIFCCFTFASAEIVPGRYIVRFKASREAANFSKTSDLIRSMQAETQSCLVKVFPKPVRTLAPRVLWAGGAVAVSLAPSELELVKKDPLVDSVIPVEYRTWIFPTPPLLASEPTFAWGVVKTRAPEVWKTLNINGSGVLVGHLDSGLVPGHPALAGQVFRFKDFVATTTASSIPLDENGHGSHTAGTIAGKTDNIGMAPGAMLVVARILDSNNQGSTEQIFAAMQWMLDPDGNPDTNDFPRVVNNSWGSSDTSDKTFWDIVNTWVKAGIVPVFAAGNNGYDNGKVGVPAAYPQSCAVGAVNSTDELAFFSSTGPAIWNKITYIKPDVTAPGTNILSVNFKGGLTGISGTSMAAPHVSGMIALLLQANPALTVDEIFRICRETAVDVGEKGADNKFGYGRIDAFAAVKKALDAASGTTPLLVLLSRAEELEMTPGAAHTDFFERTLRGIIPRATALTESEWSTLINKLATDKTGYGKKAIQALSCARRFRQIHGE